MTNLNTKECSEHTFLLRKRQEDTLSRGMQGVQKAESTQNFSEIITGLSQCAYGSSLLKTHGETNQIL